MPEPRVIAETDLPNDCGLIAAAALRYLTAHGVKARILVYGYGKDKGHRVAVFQSGEAIAVYHDGGTRTIYHADWNTQPKAIATALMKSERDKRKVTMARWE